MEVLFRDDKRCWSAENAPANFTMLKNMATNLIRKALEKDSPTSAYPGKEGGRRPEGV